MYGIVTSPLDPDISILGQLPCLSGTPNSSLVLFCISSSSYLTWPLQQVDVDKMRESAIYCLVILFAIGATCQEAPMSSWYRFNHDNQNSAFSAHQLKVLDVPFMAWSADIPDELVAAVLGYNETMIYASSLGPFAVTAVNTLNGVPVWRTVFSSATGSAPTYYYSSSLQTGLIIVSHDSNVTALVCGTGSVIWSFAPDDVSTRFTGAPIVGNDEMVFVISRAPQGFLYALNISSGEILWSMLVDAASLWRSPAMNMDNSVLYVPNGEGTMYAVDVVNKQVRWQFTAPASLSAPSVLYDGDTARLVLTGM